MAGQVLILGASGKVGRYAGRAFEAAGWTVRRFNRQTDTLVEAAHGCDVVVNGFNPQNFHDWDNTLPRITRDVIEAAKASGATVILPGNVYHFGDVGGVWSETTPPNPVSRKGKIRLAIERDYAQSGVQTIVLRAGNFIDPEKRTCVMAMVYLRSITHNTITLPGPAETRQAMCYLGDWARAAVGLADMRGSLAQFEDIPFPGHPMTAVDIRKSAEAVLNRDLKFSRFPWWVFTMSAPVWEFARELNEMRYLWKTDHVLSGEKLKTLLPDFEATAIDEVMRHMLA